MINKNYIWTFSETALSFGPKGIFSLEYHIPRTKLGVDPLDLVNSRLWLVVTSHSESFLYAVLAPSTIELFGEGKYKDDYLLKAEALSSVRFLPQHESRGPWRLPVSSNDEGIRECAESETATFQELINNNNRVSFAQPPRVVLDQVPRTTFRDIEHAVPDQLMCTLRTVSVGDISKVRSFPDSISAIGGITLSILLSTHVEFSKEEIIRLIVALDPMSRFTNEPSGFSSEALRALRSLPPIVDTFLEEIDPEKIEPRKFIARAQNYSLDWLEKTNNAEESHENILKDVVLRMNKRGFKTKKSRSFDLFAEIGDLRFLFEIKSATDINAVSQGEKGIIQLMRYSVALSNCAPIGVRFLLLIQVVPQPSVLRYLSDVAKIAGIELWLYDKDKEWPLRMHNLKQEGLPGL